ncbi:hypothetical protein V6Z98_008648 [Aspergillus fumigatus]
MLFGDIGRRYLPHAILQLQVTQRSLLKFCGLQPHFEGASQIFGSIFSVEYKRAYTVLSLTTPNEFPVSR